MTRKNKNFLTLENRKRIKELIASNGNIYEISKELNFSYSTVYKEIEKNGGLFFYDPQEANKTPQTIKTKKHLKFFVPRLIKEFEIMLTKLKEIRDESED